MSFRLFHHIIMLMVALVMMIGCSKSGERLSEKTPGSSAQSPYVITNVNVLPMTESNKVLENVTVTIEEGIISAIDANVPENAVKIDGEGKWLIPGLIDMHVHNLADINFGSNYPTKGASLFFDDQDFMLLYIANGVTTVFELTARSEHFGQRNEIRKGNIIGPRIAMAFLIDGGESGNVANTSLEGRQTVRLAKAQGHEFIKVYSQLNVETYKAIIDEAMKQDMKVIGHIPISFRGQTEEAFVPHFGMIAHAEEFSKQTDKFTVEEAQRFAKLAKANGTWVTPNLSNLVKIAEQARSLESVSNAPSFKYVHPLMQSKWIVSNQYNQGTNPNRIAYYDKLVNFHTELVKAFVDAGVPIVAGTDAGTSGIIWGFSLHDELELLVEAGLSTQQALNSATRLPATWLEIDDRVGTVEVGKNADLILLDANPLEDISNIRKISGVFADGKWVSNEDIDKMLSELAAKNEQNKTNFDWQKRREY